METWKETGIRLKVVEEIRRIAKEQNILKVVLFGSRARGGYRRESDIDLAVSGGDANLFRLAIEEETSTLLQFDVVDLDLHIQSGLLEKIEKEGITIYEEI